MIRARFKANANDYRSINWPVKYPYWCSGYAGDMSYSIVVAYAEDEDEICKNWPEAFDIECEVVDRCEFSSRFQKPDWYSEVLDEQG